MSVENGVIIQSRMGSSRLPEKALRMIKGRPMLERIHSRAQSVEAVEGVIVATTTGSEDDEIEAYCRRKGMSVYRGEEWDLLSRLRNAAKELGLETVVRVWGDCPCIPPSLINNVVSTLNGEGLDYVSNFHAGKTFPRGTELEAYTKDALDRLYTSARDDFYRQYPYEYVTDNRGEFRTEHLENGTDVSHLSVTVDYPQDIKLVRRMYGYFEDSDTFDLDEIMEFHRTHPEVSETASDMPRNEEYKQKVSERKEGKSDEK